MSGRFLKKILNQRKPLYEYSSYDENLHEQISSALPWYTDDSRDVYISGKGLEEIDDVDEDETRAC